MMQWELTGSMLGVHQKMIESLPGVRQRNAGKFTGTFESRMEEKTLDRRDDPQEQGHIILDQNNPCIQVEFPRWEEGDSIRWISRAERYFWFYRTADATWVEIATIHLKRDTIQWLIDLSTPMEDSLGSDSRKDLNSKVVACMMLQIKDCNKFDVKVIDGRILNCDQRCPRVKLLLQDQEVVADFFLLPIDDYEAVLEMEWLTTLGDIS
ncbi:hypothetical protein BHM03_00046453 [Ensete ventricosum]|nr:hypothetical protein BHM03_00046453 [Ensete ventricosum]